MIGDWSCKGNYPVDAVTCVGSRAIPYIIKCKSNMLPSNPHYKEELAAYEEALVLAEEMRKGNSAEPVVNGNGHAPICLTKAMVAHYANNKPKRISDVEDIIRFFERIPAEIIEYLHTRK